MVSKRIKKLIVKHLLSQASFKELDELEQWINDSDNQEEFKKFIKINHLIDHNLKKFDSERTKRKLEELIKEDHKVVRLKKVLQYSKYAAILVGLMFSVYFYQVNFLNNGLEKDPVIVNTKNNIVPGTDKATLTLEDGSHIVLAKGGNYKTNNAQSNGEKITYNKDEKTKEIAFNYLTIPRGGQFFIELSDGTQVWLNSESQLKYPVCFKKGETRKVELVYGEAYFDVSPSTIHEGSKFKVINKSQEIEVLGTEFNIKAYKDESNIYTTLVEGKVAVNTSSKNKILKPSEQTNLNLNNLNMEVTTVNVYNEISWKDGVFSFRKKPLSEIMPVLSRWYDIDFEFANPEIKNEGFNGVIGKDQKIEEILKIIKAFNIIEDYEIKNKTIILK